MQANNKVLEWFFLYNAYPQCFCVTPMAQRRSQGVGVAKLYPKEDPEEH